MSSKFPSSFAEVRARWREPGGYREVLHIGLPLVAGMASTTVMQFTDRLFLSHYSVESIAAALPAGLASLLLLLTCMGVTGYASVFIAQYIGAGQPHRVGGVLWQSLIASLVFGGLLAMTSLLAEPIFSLAGHAPELQRLEETYFIILQLGSVLSLVGNSLGTFFSGRGRTRPVMLANIAAAVVNVPLDYVLINGVWFFPEMGIAGAAVATVMGWGVTAVLLAIAVFNRDHETRFGVRSQWRFDAVMMHRLMRYGLPSGVNFFMELFAVTWFVFVVGTLGEVALAATNIAFSINSVAFLPTVGLNIAVGTMVGQAMGRGDPDGAARATGSTLHVAMAWMTALALVFVLLPGPLVDLFRPDNLTPAAYADIRETTARLLAYVAFYCLFDSLTIIFCGALKGAGDTAFVMWNMTVGCIFVLIIPAYALRALGWWSLDSLWLVFSVYVSVLAVASYVRFRLGRWRKLRLVHPA